MLYARQTQTHTHTHTHTCNWDYTTKRLIGSHQRFFPWQILSRVPFKNGLFHSSPKTKMTRTLFRWLDLLGVSPAIVVCSACEFIEPESEWPEVEVDWLCAKNTPEICRIIIFLSLWMGRLEVVPLTPKQRWKRCVEGEQIHPFTETNSNSSDSPGDGAHTEKSLL